MKQRFLQIGLVCYFGNVLLFVVTRQRFTNYRSGRYTFHQILKVVIFFMLLQEISRKWTVATIKPNLYQQRVGIVHSPTRLVDRLTPSPSWLCVRLLIRRYQFNTLLYLLFFLKINSQLSQYIWFLFCSFRHIFQFIGRQRWLGQSFKNTFNLSQFLK